MIRLGLVAQPSALRPKGWAIVLPGTGTVIARPRRWWERLLGIGR